MATIHTAHNTVCVGDVEGRDIYRRQRRDCTCVHAHTHILSYTLVPFNLHGVSPLLLPTPCNKARNCCSTGHHHNTYRTMRDTQNTTYSHYYMYKVRGHLTQMYYLYKAWVTRDIYTTTMLTVTSTRLIQGKGSPETTMLHNDTR